MSGPRLSRVLVVGLLLLAGCQTTKSGKRYAQDETARLLKRLETVSLELGEYPIEGSQSVLDGDTIRVKGLSNTLRLLGIDTEEIFHHEAERREFAAGWESYKKKMRGDSAHPVKMSTPVGEDAKVFAQGFFEGVDKVKLERDHPGEIRDFYGRYLAYVFAFKDGKWVNYNIECVRAGFSPYFVKYGRSRRFHKEFMDAEKQARAAKTGIWDPTKLHYPDYEERLKWWWGRENTISRFEKMAEEDPEHFVALTRWDAMLRLEQRVGETVTVLGSVSEVKFGETGPSVVKLARSRGNSLDVVFFDRDVLLGTGLQFKSGEYVQIRGVVAKYRDPYRNVDRLQLQVTLPGQVLAPSTQLQDMLSGEEAKKPGRTETEGE